MLSESYGVLIVILVEIWWCASRGSVCVSWKQMVLRLTSSTDMNYQCVRKATENLTRQCLCVEISDWTFNMLTLLQPLSPPSLPLLSLLAPFLNLLTPSHFLILHSIKGISWAGCNLGGGEAEETPVRQQCLPVTPTLPRYPQAPQPHENTWCSLDSLCCMCM